MKMIGKIATLAMTLALAFALTACGGNASSSAADSSESASANSADVTEASEGTSESSEIATETNESASASSEDADDEASSADEAPDMYENEFFAIRYKLPEGWSFKDTSAIGGINQVIAAASETTKIDMAALNADQSQIVLVGLKAPSDATADMTAEEYLDAQEEEMVAGFGDNFTYSSESATITFAGNDRELPASIMNVDLGESQLFICQAIAEKDGAFLSIIAMGASKDEVTSAFENFSGASE